jgi:hypothetical protein
VAALAADAAGVSGEDAFAALVARLGARAEELAQAHGESLILARRGDPRRWRQAHLLWPHFAKG